MRHLLFILAVALSSTSAFGRHWTDDSGKYHCDAAFLEQKGTQVWLLKDATNRPVVIEWSKLSAADRAFVESLKNPASAATPAPATTPDEREYVTRRTEPLVQTADMSWFKTFAVRPASLANMQPAPPEEMKAPKAQKPFQRKVHSGKCGSFHLPSSMGTALCWFGHPCCHYLTNIEFAGSQPPRPNSPGYTIWRTLPPSGGITQWAIAMNPEFCGMYAVHCKMNGKWKFYEWTWRELTH